MVQDGNSCTLEKSVTILKGEGNFVFSLGPDQTITYGDSVAIIPNVLAETVKSFTWNFKTIKTFSPTVKPIETTNYKLTATDLNGCTHSDDINILVQKKYHYYAPNIFSPNDDGENDIFTVFAGVGVSTISNLSIFNRWGELVYFSTTVSADTGWNGRINGKIADADAYIYMAEVEYVDGSKEIIKGDVALSR